MTQLNYALSDQQVTRLVRQFPEKDMTEIKSYIREEVDDFIQEDIIEGDIENE